jgi:hypothetical protein
MTVPWAWFFVTAMWVGSRLSYKPEGLTEVQNCLLSPGTARVAVYVVVDN